ncbi:MAG: peptidylprolyl isomerase [Alphaproteobacteria bacterium]|nr:peptidylprolyl isomerase [Alphaproteobacteria bacterium]
MSIVKKGDNVKVHYTGKLENGHVFDSSQGRQPLGFKVGAGQMIAGFDKGVEGMKVGEHKTIQIPFNEGYGAKKEHMIFKFPKDKFPKDNNPEIGKELNMMDEEGRNFTVKIIAIHDDHITLDANHFLAGENLIFDIEMIEIQ